MNWSALQYENPDCPIDVSSEPGSIVMQDKASQPAKHESPILVTDAGRKNDFKFRHPENTKSPKKRTQLPDSNATADSWSCSSP
jgi:hypothetical protein